MSYKFSCEFNAVMENGKFDPEPYGDSPEDFALIGQLPSVHDDLYGFDWLEIIENEYAPISRDYYHIYIEGHYWFEYKNNSNGADVDLEIEIDSVRYSAL